MTASAATTGWLFFWTVEGDMPCSLTVPTLKGPGLRDGEASLIKKVDRFSFIHVLIVHLLALGIELQIGGGFICLFFA